MSPIGRTLFQFLCCITCVLRGDPIKVCRHISAIVNSVDDNGIMVGNWKDDFSGGTAPTDWHGSAAILQQFLKTKRPVKFGQCWVFSGLCATCKWSTGKWLMLIDNSTIASVTRCIGIPSRVVTNYQSAHDTHSSITVDRFFDEEGEPIKHLNTDSIWNFHSWIEVWIQRPDLSLSGAYDGWNVIGIGSSFEVSIIMSCLTQMPLLKNLQTDSTDVVLRVSRLSNKPKWINPTTESLSTRRSTQTKCFGCTWDQNNLSNWSHNQPHRRHWSFSLRSLFQLN